MSSPDFEPVLDVLRRQRDDGLHLGAQICVELHGERVLDTAIGESVPGRDLRPDDVMLWYSSSKPSTAVAVLQLWERGRLGLDDLVADYVPGWGAGKEHCTVRHVLTHTGGFPMYREGLGDQNLPFEEKVARIAAHPAEWEPGTEAAYHLTTGWTVLGAVIEAVDGRPVRQYLDEEVFGPAGLASTHCALTPDQQAELGDRLVPMHWRGHTLPVRTKDGRLEQVPYNIEERGHNETWYRARVEPGSACQGPASDLARFYSCLLGHGPQILEPRTVEAMIATHRSGMRDKMFGNLKIPWGLGVQTSGGISGGVGRRAFGHGGLSSSRGVGDPDVGLAFGVICNGLPDPISNEQRMYEITDAVYTALGEEVARRFRRPHRPPVDAAYSS